MSIPGIELGVPLALTAARLAESAALCAEAHRPSAASASTPTSTPSSSDTTAKNGVDGELSRSNRERWGFASGWGATAITAPFRRYSQDRLSRLCTHPETRGFVLRVSHYLPAP